MRGKTILAALVATSMAGYTAAADFRAEPALMASLSVPLGSASAATTDAARYSLAVTARGHGAAAQHSRILELSAPVSAPTSLSLNGVPMFPAAGYHRAGAADTGMTSEEEFASVVIVASVVHSPCTRSIHTCPVGVSLKSLV